jgi:hypothetical protein
MRIRKILEEYLQSKKNVSINMLWMVDAKGSFLSLAWISEVQFLLVWYSCLLPLHLKHMFFYEGELY